MSEPDVPVAGGAMPANGEQTEAAAERERLSAVVDDLREVHKLIEAAWMAAADTEFEQCDPAQFLLDVTTRKLCAARGKLDALRALAQEAAHV